MAVGPFGTIISTLDRFGITEVIIPFVLIFAIIFAILQKIQIFQNNKKINIIIALSIALLSIFPHATGRYQEVDIVNVINTSLPQIGLILIGLVMVMILVGLVKGDNPGLNSLLLALSGLVAVILLIVVFWNALFPYTSPRFFGFLSDPSLQALVIILAVFGLIVYFVQKEEGTGGGAKDAIKGLHEGIKYLFGGGKP